MALQPLPGRAAGPVLIPPGQRGGGRGAPSASSLLAARGVAAPRINQDAIAQASAIGAAAAHRKPASSPIGAPGGSSIWDQVSDLVKGVPGGLVHMGVDIAKDVQGIGRTVNDAAHGDLGNNPDDYFPFLTGMQHSLSRTGQRSFEFSKAMLPGGQSPHDTEYAKALREGRIVSTMAEDMGNAALLAGPAAKGLTVAGGTAGAENAAARAAAIAAGEEAPQMTVRGALSRAGETVNRLSHPVNEALATPARIWTAPVKALAKGVELPERLFGLTEEGTARSIPGIKQALDKSGIVDRVAQSERVAPLIERGQKYLEGRAQGGTVRGVLMDQLADTHVASSLLDKMTAPARRILKGNADLEHGMLLAKTGLVPTLEKLQEARDFLPPAQYDDLMNRTLGREAKPTDQALDYAVDYAHGRLEPALAEKIDTAWPHVERALKDVERIKLEGEGRSRGPLSPEQLGNDPMPTRVADKMSPLEQRWQDLHDQLHGYDTPKGDHVPGLYEKIDTARQQVPEVEPQRLIDARSLAAQRRAGALGAEQGLAERAADTATGKAITAGDQAVEARQATVQDALKRASGPDKMAPEEVLRIGEAERRLPGNGPRIVSDAELDAARQVRDQAGTDRMGPVFSTQAAADTAAGRAEQATAAGDAAQGRIYDRARSDAESRPPQLNLNGDTWEPPVEHVPPPGAAIGADERQQVVSLHEDLKRRARQAAAEEVDNLGPVSVNHMPWIPDRWFSDKAKPTILTDELSGAQRDAAIRGRKYGGDRPGELDWITTLSKDEQRLLKRNMGPKPPAGEVQSHWDEFAQDFGAARNRVDVPVEEFAAEWLRHVKIMDSWRSIEDGVRPAFPEVLDQLSPAERTFVEHLPKLAPRGRGLGSVDKMVEAYREGRRLEAGELADQALPEAQHGPNPWEMPRDAYTNEVAGTIDVLDAAQDVPPEQWTPEQNAAANRIKELIPESVTGGNPTIDMLHDRILEVARRVGHTPLEPRLGGALHAEGLAAREDARAVAEEAWRIDSEAKQQALTDGTPPPQLSRGSLSADERKIYDALERRGRSMSAADRAEGARQRFGLGQRVAGERAGERAGVLSERERVFSGESRRQEARAQALEPRVAAAEDRAGQVAEEAVGKPVRFGERRGKRMRDVQNLEREARVKAKRLSWLEDERIPEMQARLAQGPKEVAPARFIPALATGERLHKAVSEMAANLADVTGDPAMGPRLEALLADVPTTMRDLQSRLGERGLDDPAYVPGLVDEPVKGSAGGSGRPDQLPYYGRTPSERQRQYGHVPKKVATVARSLSREMAAVSRNKTADLLAEQYARPGSEILNELHAAGEIDDHVHAGLMDRAYDRSLDMAKELERHDYRAWDPKSPNGDMSPTKIGPDTLFLPAKVATDFKRWFKPASTSGALKVYDAATRTFKHSVLAMSPMWNVNNIVGNAFMATVGAGETPATIARYALEARKIIRQEAELGELHLPPRLFGAGQSAEVSRMYAEGVEPRTPLGRGINKAYALNETVDNIGRSAVFLAKKARGFSDEQAVQAALKAMGDFSNLSPFERNVVRRVVPFYAWMKHVTQATYHLAAEHPFRVAWLMHVSDQFNPRDPNTPDWLASNIPLGSSGWVLPLGGFNPYEGTPGSFFTSPKEWLPSAMASTNPIIKLGAAEAGINLDRAAPFTHPAGVGSTDPYGNSTFGFQSPGDIATYAERMLPPGRLLYDATHDPVIRYDNGDPVLRKGKPIPSAVLGGKLGTLAKDVRIFPFPAQIDPQAQAARAKQLEKAQKAADKRRSP